MMSWCLCLYFTTYVMSSFFFSYFSVKRLWDLEKVLYKSLLLFDPYYYYSRHAHKICSSSPLRVRHLALFWLILRCLTHGKEKKYSSCQKNVIPLAQIWSGTYLKKMLHAQEQVRQPYWICRTSWGVLSAHVSGESDNKLNLEKKS